MCLYQNVQVEEDMFQSFQEDQEEGSKTPEELFLEHFTAEPVRVKILKEIISSQGVMTMTTPASPLPAPCQPPAAPCQPPASPLPAPCQPPASPLQEEYQKF